MVDVSHIETTDTPAQQLVGQRSLKGKHGCKNKNQTEISVSIRCVWAQCLLRLGWGAKNRPGASTLFGKNRERR